MSKPESRIPGSWHVSTSRPSPKAQSSRVCHRLPDQEVCETCCSSVPDCDWYIPRGHDGSGPPIFCGPSAPLTSLLGPHWASSSLLLGLLLLVRLRGLGLERLHDALVEGLVALLELLVVLLGGLHARGPRGHSLRRCVGDAPDPNRDSGRSRVRAPEDLGRKSRHQGNWPHLALHARRWLFCISAVFIA